MQIELEQISHWFGDKQVLKDLSFTVQGGYLTGFVGANGAGKTTTMRAILGLLRPAKGQILLSGKKITESDRARFGYMPEERGLYPKMKVREQIIYFARLHGLSRKEAEANTNEMLEHIELIQHADDKLESLSLGNQQRAQICSALVHRPEFLILDEPFSGLDPIAVDAVLGLLQEQAKLGVPILFSSHQLEVVERLSDQLVIISQGEIKSMGSRKSLQLEHSKGLYRLNVDDSNWLAQMPDIEVVKTFADGVVIRIQAKDDAGADARSQDVLAEAVRRGPVRGFQRELTPLAQIFREVR